MNASTFSEPFTPRGVAAFARAKAARLLLVQFLFAAVAAAAIAVFFYNNCFPTLQAAIQNLPPNSQIAYGSLDWNGNSSQPLAEGRFLAFDVDLDHSGQFRSTADFQVEFGRQSIRVFSLFGYADFLYPPGDLAFSQTDLDPLWHAWRAEILFSIALATFITLPLVWWLLASLYFLPVWLLGFLTNRDLDLRASWKLCAAAQLPGALLMTAGILLYSMNFIGLVSFLFIFGAHLVLDWLYLLFGFLFLPRVSTAPLKENPFDRNKKTEPPKV